MKHRTAGHASRRDRQGETGLDRRRELFEEADVVLEEEAQVLDAVLEHRDALDTHAQGETGVTVGIDAVQGQDIRVHHAASEDFKPSGSLAHIASLAVAEGTGDVHLGGRLREGEIGRAQADAGVGAEQLLGEVGQRLLQVGEGDTLIDIKGFNLVEHAVRTGGNRLVAEDAPGGDEADGEGVGFHVAHLHGRGVGTEQDIGVFLDEKRVLHITGRMLFGEIEGGEDMPVVLYLGSFGDGKSEAGKDIEYLILDHREGMPRAEAHGVSGQGEVHAAASAVGIGEAVFQVIHLVQGGSLEVIQGAPDFLFLLEGNVLEVVEKGGNGSFLAEVTDSELFHFGGGAGGESGDFRNQPVDFLYHLTIHLMIRMAKLRDFIEY